MDGKSEDALCTLHAASWPALHACFGLPRSQAANLAIRWNVLQQKYGCCQALYQRQDGSTSQDRQDIIGYKLRD